MHPISILIIASLSGLCLSSCSPNSVNGDTLKIQGTQMRTTNAFGTQLLMGGTRSRAGKNNFEGYQLLKLTRELDGKATMSMQVDQVRGLGDKLTAKGIPSASGTIEYKRTQTYIGTFVIVAVNQKNDLLRELQKPENAAFIKMLSRQREPRIITAVATTLNHEHKIDSNLTAGAEVDAKIISMPKGSIGIELKATNLSTYKFSDNTVFAYEMSIPAWQRDPSGKLYIVDYVEDRLGPRNAAPMHGTSLNPHEAPIVEKNQIMFVD